MFQNLRFRQLIPLAVTASVLVLSFFSFPWMGGNIMVMVTNVSTIMTLPAGQFFLPNIGEDVLPPRVQVGLYLLRENNLEDFRLSESWRNDPLLHQRMAEAAYPILLRQGSKNIISRLEEVPQDCQLINGYYVQQEPDYAVAYSRCP